MKVLTLILLIPFFNIVSVKSQNTENSNISESQIYIETDPTALFFNGFSLVAKRSSTFADKLNVGVGFYKSTLPDFFIDDNEKLVGKGWSGKNVGTDFFFDYFFFDANEGFSAGMTVSLYKFTVARNNQEVSYNSLGGTARIGYTWRPFKKFEGFYVFPWVGLGADEKISGTNTIDGESFETPPVSFIPALQIGFSF